MIESAVAFSLFDKILATIGLIREGKKQRTQKVDIALNLLYTALNETSGYIAYRKDGKRRDKKKERALARLWHNASIPLRSLDKEFADRCFLKGSYWMEPDAWDKRRIEQTGIAIDRVFSETRSLLLG